MPNLTIRNIPENIMKKLKTLSEIERRSMNSEILLIIEKGLDKEKSNKNKKYINPEMRIKLWNNLSGKWKDSRKTEEIIKGIIDDRSEGRDFTL